MIIFLTLIFLLIFSLIVFGGGQVFMPLFKWLWVDMTHVIDVEKAQNVFAIANSTPGPFSTKLSLISGYFAGNGEWWSYILMIFTYLIFILPAMLLMWYVSNKFFKFENSRALQVGIRYTKPIIVGIFLSLIMSIVMAGFWPELNVYFQYKTHSIKQDFIDSHLTQIIVWSIVAFGLSFYAINKKYNLLMVILINLTVGFVVFII